MILLRLSRPASLAPVVRGFVCQCRAFTPPVDLFCVRGAADEAVDSIFSGDACPRHGECDGGSSPEVFCMEKL